MRPAIGVAACALGARACAASVIACAILCGCAGGMPLLHPAKTLATGEVRAASGFSANVAVGSLANGLNTARSEAVANPNGPGPAGTGPDPTYARGALVAAAVAPGLAPFVGARVGTGQRYEGGIAYTGRGARIDMRRSFDKDAFSLSVGLGGSFLFYGHQYGDTLPNVDLGQLQGYGLDVPILFGWESTAGIYQAWVGVRGGGEHVAIAELRSEPKSPSLGTPPIALSATRYFGGGLVGFAIGFRHVHVAFELDVAYQHVDGTYNATNATIDGLTLTPASAIWWTF